MSIRDRTLPAWLIGLALIASGAIACAGDGPGTAQGGVSTGDGGGDGDASTRRDGGPIVFPGDGGRDDDFGFEELDVPDDGVEDASAADSSAPGAPDASVDHGFTCDSDRMDDGVCDCGCGRPDPDCGDFGCPEAGCFADGCELCEGATGPITCERGVCPAGFELDGACDCGCREHDPDCIASDACLEPGCSAPGCARCYDADGTVVECEDWLCDFEQQSANDGCNCGCGAADADCEQGLGCEAPGCEAEACTTCRAANGSAMSCGP